MSRPQSWNTDTDWVALVRMVIRARDREDRVPVLSMSAMNTMKAVLGIKPVMVDERGLRKWQVPADWPDKLRQAGIDPGTLELVDMERALVAARAVQQRRELEMQEKARKGIREGLREATAKYRPPAAPSASQLIRNHVMTGRIVRELRKGNDSI